MLNCCSKHDVPFEICGKLIIALDEEEYCRLFRLYDRKRANGVRAHVLQGDRIRALEPHASGVAALQVPDAGLVDFRACASSWRTLLGARAQKSGSNGQSSASSVTAAAPGSSLGAAT